MTVKYLHEWRQQRELAKARIADVEAAEATAYIASEQVLANAEQALLAAANQPPLLVFRLLK